MTTFGGGLVALVLLAGTGMQMAIAMGDLRRQEVEMAAASDAIDDLKAEVSKGRPLRWFRHHRLVEELLQDSDSECQAWKSVRRRMLSWALIFAAAFFGFLEAIGITM